MCDGRKVKQERLEGLEAAKRAWLCQRVLTQLNCHSFNKALHNIKNSNYYYRNAADLGNTLWRRVYASEAYGAYWPGSGEKVE